LNGFAQELKASEKVSTDKNILYVNPAHLSKGNYTFTFERRINSVRSYQVMLSGGEKANYVAVAFGMNYYPFKPNSVNYLVGLSLMGYESPIETGVPVHSPMNEFYESGDDNYYAAFQLTNGALLKISKYFYFELDGKIGPAYNLSADQFCWSWSVNINIGIPFE